MSGATERRRWRVWVMVALAAALAAGAAALAVSIAGRGDEEARAPLPPAVELDDVTDPARWGELFPDQYESYLRTVDQQRTRHGGSEAVPRTPTSADPRSTVARSRLEADPRLLRMWSGYAFARDARESRGHAYMLDDETFTGRHRAGEQPSGCLQRLPRAGGGGAAPRAVGRARAARPARAGHGGRSRVEVTAFRRGRRARPTRPQRTSSHARSGPPRRRSRVRSRRARSVLSQPQRS